MSSFFRKCSLIAVAAILALQACGAPEQSDRAASADRIFTNAKVYTVNSQQPWAEAVAVSGNEIVYVGENAGALELAGNLPSFDDGYVHATINVDELDPDCEMRGLVLNEPTQASEINHILNLSFGMLGINSAIVVKRFTS